MPLESATSPVTEYLKGQAPESQRAVEALKQNGNMLDTLLRLFNSKGDKTKGLEKGELFASLVPIGIALLSFLSIGAKKEGAEPAKKEESKDRGEMKSSPAAEATSSVAPEKKTADIKAETQAKLQEVRVAVEKLPMASVFYVGDSYMQGLVQSSSGKNIDAASGRRLSANVKKALDMPDDPNNKTPVVTIALNKLDDPNCKTLVVNGGLNDFYSGNNPRLIGEKLHNDYQRIIEKAKTKGVHLIICDVPKIKKGGQANAAIDQATDDLNKYLKSQAGLLVNIVDTDQNQPKLDKGGIHPTSYSYLRAQVKSSLNRVESQRA